MPPSRSVLRPLRLAALSALALFAAGEAAPAPRARLEELVLGSGPGSRERISFRVRTLLGPETGRRTVTDATIEGAPGTDLDIRSQAGDFTLAARLKTDLLASGRVRVLADLTTRRAAGRSPRGLPLYEEDVQQRVVELSTDGSQSLVVLPFGRNPGGEELALDILPRTTGRPVRDGSGRLVPPEIRIAESGPEGWIRIDAEVVPHRYRVQALLERGREAVVAGAGSCAFREPCAIDLLASRGGARAGRLDLTVIRYVWSNPDPFVTVEFDLRAAAPAGAGAPASRGPARDRDLVRRSAGTGFAGKPLMYTLPHGDLLPGSPDRLRLILVPEALP